MDDDQRLVGRVLAGERAAFLALIARYERLVQHVVTRIVLDRADAEEVCQDVFLRVYRGLPGFRGDSKLSTWIGRVAHRTALKHVEKRRLPSVPASGAGGDTDHAGTRRAERATPGLQLDDVVRAELRAFVRERVADLPVQYRIAVTLYHLEGMTISETAAVMNLPEGTVKSHLFRARRLLRERLEERIGGDGDD